MFMMANLFVIVFILLMAYWWSAQGLFSAILHLGAVIVAGAIAFAVWEPVTLWLLMPYLPHYAWGLGLAGPFVIVLLVLRALSDKYAPANLTFVNAFNTLGGALVGAASGILTAGITLIAIGFLPMPQTIAGYQPYEPGAGGEVEPSGDDLWVGVDDIAASFYSTLSASPSFITGGAFSSSSPLGTYQPELAKQASILRLRSEDNASVVAAPGTVEIDEVFVSSSGTLNVPAPIENALGAGVTGAEKVVIVRSNWEQTRPTFDGDGGLRLPPSHIRLIGHSDAGTNAELHAPVGYTAGTGPIRFYSFENRSQATAVSDATLGFVFVIPSEQEPAHLLARRLRLTLPEEATTDTGQVAEALGQPGGGGDDEEGDDEGGGQERSRSGGGGGEGPLRLTGALPGSNALSRTDVTELENEGTAISGGRQRVSEASGFVRDNVRLDSIAVPDHSRPVRLRVEGQNRSSLLGRAVDQAENAGPVYLTDTDGNTHAPHGFVLLEGEQMLVEVTDVMDALNQGRRAPLDQLTSDNELYLYFAIRPGTTIRSYTLRGEAHQLDQPLTVR